MLFSDYSRQTGVGWLKSTNFQFSRRYIFVCFRNNVDIDVHYNNMQSVLIYADTNNFKDDLEMLMT